MTMLTEADRSAILDAEVQRFVLQGYRLQARTPTTAQLIRPKTFSVLAAVIWLLVLLVGLLIYLLLYLARSDEMVYLSVDETGFITGSGNGVRQVKPGRPATVTWTCNQCGYANHELRTTCKRCRTPAAQ